MEKYMYEIPAEQLKLLQDNYKDLQDFAINMKNLTAVLETKKKSFSDLISLLCMVAGLDKEKVSLDLEKGTLVQNIQPEFPRE
jgi:hypothetical protein